MYTYFHTYFAVFSSSQWEITWTPSAHWYQSIQKDVLKRNQNYSGQSSWNFTKNPCHNSKTHFVLEKKKKQRVSALTSWPIAQLQVPMLLGCCRIFQSPKATVKIRSLNVFVEKCLRKKCQTNESRTVIIAPNREPQQLLFTFMFVQLQNNYCFMKESISELIWFDLERRNQKQSKLMN